MIFFIIYLLTTAALATSVIGTDLSSKYLQTYSIIYIMLFFGHREDATHQ